MANAQTVSSENITAYASYAWPTVKATLVNWINNSISALDGGLIYHLQLDIAPLLDYAIDTNDTTLLYDIDALYAQMLDTRFLSQKTEYKFWNGYNAEGKYQYIIVPTRLYYAWLDGEGLEHELDSSQFMYALTRLTAGLWNDASATKKYAPIITDFYTRMVLGLEPGTKNGVFQKRGYGCTIEHYDPVERFNHATYTSYLATRSYQGSASYCNALDDTDLWIMAGTIEMLALDAAHPGLFSLTSDERQQMIQYTATAANLLKSRFFPGNVQFLGIGLPSLVFDPGSWKDHPDNAFAGYEGDTFPDVSQHYAVPSGISWDVSHARRFVQVMESFYRNVALTGVIFPTPTDMYEIANQVVFGTFRGTLDQPKFTNFTDGSNGWYRVNYSDRVGFGYYPYAQSESFADGGYCRLARYSPDIKKICDGIYNLTVSTDPVLSDYRKNTFELCYMKDYVKQSCNSFDAKNANASLLNFYSSLLMMTPIKAPTR